MPGPENLSPNNHDPRSQAVPSSAPSVFASLNLPKQIVGRLSGLPAQVGVLLHTLARRSPEQIWAGLQFKTEAAFQRGSALEAIAAALSQLEIIKRNLSDRKEYLYSSLAQVGRGYLRIQQYGLALHFLEGASRGLRTLSPWPEEPLFQAAWVRAECLERLGRKGKYRAALEEMVELLEPRADRVELHSHAGAALYNSLLQLGSSAGLGEADHRRDDYLVRAGRAAEAMKGGGPLSYHAISPLLHRSFLAHGKGAADRAERFAVDAYARALHCDDPDMLRDAVRWMVKLYQSFDREHEALLHVEEGMQKLRASGRTETVHNFLLVLVRAQIHLNHGDLFEARTDADAAQELASKIPGVPVYGVDQLFKTQACARTLSNKPEDAIRFNRLRLELDEKAFGRRSEEVLTVIDDYLGSLSDCRRAYPQLYLRLLLRRALLQGRLKGAGSFEYAAARTGLAVQRCYLSPDPRRRMREAVALYRLFERERPDIKLLAPLLDGICVGAKRSGHLSYAVQVRKRQMVMVCTYEDANPLSKLEARIEYGRSLLDAGRWGAALHQLTGVDRVLSDSDAEHSLHHADVMSDAGYAYTQLGDYADAELWLYDARKALKKNGEQFSERAAKLEDRIAMLHEKCAGEAEEFELKRSHLRKALHALRRRGEALTSTTGWFSEENLKNMAQVGVMLHLLGEIQEKAEGAAPSGLMGKLDELRRDMAQIQKGLRRRQQRKGPMH